jgi:hypothetical protein
MAEAYDADVHLRRLCYLDVEQPWYRDFLRNVKEYFSPPKLPPLQVTSKPVAVKNIWGLYGDRRKQSTSMSVLLHVLVVLIAIWLGSLPSVQRAVKQGSAWGLRSIGAMGSRCCSSKARRWAAVVVATTRLPASKGRLPRVAPRQTPFTAVVNAPIQAADGADDHSAAQCRFAAGEYGGLGRSVRQARTGV